MRTVVYPKNIIKGSKIAVISPAGAVSTEQLTKQVDSLLKLGYEPVLGKHALGSFNFGYLYSGSEQQRIDDLNWALNDSSIDAIWATRGGYGCQHLLRHINLNSFRKNPKWYIGYSDNTVIQSFLLKKGFASIHGQTIKTSSFGVTPKSYEGITDILQGKKPKYHFQSTEYNRKGKAEGLLVGGNLSLVYALLGTPYSFDFKDRILFIEEIGEDFYALDRMLISLDLAGVFKKIKGLVVGGMTNMGKEADNKDYEASFDGFANQIIHHRIAEYDFPVVYDFPNGHIYDNRPLIIGGNVVLESGKDAKLSFK